MTPRRGHLPSQALHRARKVEQASVADVCMAPSYNGTFRASHLGLRTGTQELSRMNTKSLAPSTLPVVAFIFCLALDAADDCLGRLDDADASR